MEYQPPTPEPFSADPGRRRGTDHLRDVVSRAWECGADDARRTARESLPRARQAASELAADLAYGLGYGASFAAALFDQLGANEASCSGQRGMAAGRTAAEALLRRFGRREAPTPPPPQADQGPQQAT